MERHQWIAADSVQPPQIYSIGFSDDPRITRFGPSVRNQYIIHYVLSGKGTFNGSPVGRGQGFLIVPGMHEEYFPDTMDPWSFLWVISEDPCMQVFFDCHQANGKTGIFRFQNLYELEPIVQRLLACTDSFSSSTQLAELFLHIFHACVATERKGQRSAAELYFEFSVNYVKTNLHLPLSVADICQATGITQPYLYRIFKQAAGCSPKQYISGCKLTEAKRLLLQTELSVSQIAASVGFENVLDFSKFFAKQTGISPSGYRRREL